MKFSDAHAWVELNEDIATVGITNFGRIHLGEIVNIELPKLNKIVKKNDAVCVIESNKAAVDFHTPLSGKIIEVNEKLLKDLNILNTSSEGMGWIFKLKINDKKEYDKLLTFNEYEKKLK